MTPDEVQAVHQRAADVVNGFKTVREQQARDVLKLTIYIAQLEHERNLLKVAWEKHQPQKADGSYSSAFDSLFGNIFGAKK